MFEDNDTGAGALVKMMDGKVVADSRDVARAFGRLYKNVLATIRDLLERRPVLTANFSAVSGIQQTFFGERASPYYLMDRKGFVILVFGRQLSAIVVEALRSNGIKRLGVRLLPFGAVPESDGLSGGASDPDPSDEAGERWAGRALSKRGVH